MSNKESSLRQAILYSSLLGNAGGGSSSGKDGVSPTIQIEEIAGGHRVTITDKDHPSGQSFDIMDGVSNIDTELSSTSESPVQNKVIKAALDQKASMSDIPPAVTEQIVSGWGFTKNDGNYSKPSGGIPKSDLASDVKSSLGKADTALQQHQDISGKANVDDVYTKAEVDQRLVGAMVYKGTKRTTSDLPQSGNSNGDTWHVNEDGSEWAWNGSSWEELGTVVDLSGKQDIISDISTIRTNAAAGAAKKSCDEETVAGYGFTKNTGDYSKPSGGIPKSDLSDDVQTSLGKADTALQQHQDISGKADKADVYTKAQIDQKLVGAMDYKGTKATVSELPTSGNATGDVWHITADGSEWAWNGSAWEELGTAVDLSGYRTASAQDAIDAVQDAAIAAKYTKPGGGIPKSDLASDVQTSLGKADTALQSHQSLGGYATEQWVGQQGYQTATQVQTAISGKANSADLATVATSGDYDDLTNKPTIPPAVTESTVSGWGFTKNTGTYSKPSGGIPKTDLATDVQTSLGKADTALQSHQSLSAYRTASAQDTIDNAQNVEIGKKANTGDLAEVAFSGDYNDLLNRPDDDYIFADEIPQNADHSAKYVLPDGYIYVYGEHTYHRVYNAAVDGLLNKRPALNQPVDYSETQNGIFLSAPIPWDSSWTQWEKTPTIIRISGIEQLVPVWYNNSIQIWYYKTDGSYKSMVSQQNIHSFVGGTPAVGDSIDLPCEFNMADNNYYPLEGTGYVRVWLGISADGAITAEDVKDLVINVPFYDSDVTATEWYNSGERYTSDPQVEQNTEDIAALDTRVTALEEDSGSGGGISVSTNQVLYAVGDSITRGAVAGGEDYAWPKHVIDINGYDATNSRNLGQNGLGFDTAATSSGDTIKDIVDRTDFSAADIVTVALGCNDWSNSNARLANVWSNMEYCFNKIRSDNPYCKLFYILPFNQSFRGSFSNFYCLSFKGDSNPLCPYSYTLMQFVNMIKDKLMEPTFRAFRINVIDMVECAAINRHNITTALADQVHPTAATQEALGEEIARRIVLADGAPGVMPVYTGGVS